MIVHGVYPGNILDCNLQRFALSFIGNRAGQLDIAISHDNIQSYGSPGLLVELSEHAISDCHIVFHSRRCSASETCKGVEKVCTTDYSNQLVVTDDGEAFDMVPFHFVYNVLKRCVLSNRFRTGCHDLFDLPTVGMNVLVGKPARPDQKL